MPHSPNDPPPDDRSVGADLSRRTDNGFNRVTAKLERQGEGIARLMIQVGGGIVVTLLAASRFLG